MTPAPEGRLALKPPAVKATEPSAATATWKVEFAMLKTAPVVASITAIDAFPVAFATWLCDPSDVTEVEVMMR